MKLLNLLFCLLLICFSANALTLNTDKDSYEKGETINVSGSSESAVRLTISNGKIKIAEEELIPEGNLFEFSYKSTYLDPSGQWTITAENDMNRIEKDFEVRIPARGAYFLITFFSPSTGEHKRTKNIEINVEITDAGVPINSAEVVAYGASGERLQLEPKGEGIYYLNYAIPFNAPLGEWNLVLTAKKGYGNNLTGGENSIKLTVIETPILLEVVRPSTQIIGLGERTTIIVKPTYFNGKTVDESTTLTARINSEIVDFARESNGEYIAYYTPGELGELKIEVSAEDSAQNEGSKVLTIIVGGWLEFFIGQYWLYLLIGIIIAALIVYKTQSKVIYDFRLNSLKKEKEKTKLMLKKVQEDYFKKGVIDKTNYEPTSSEYKKKLCAIDEKINVLMKKKEKIKKAEE